MDPFTQRMLEKAEERSRVLGVCNASASKFPLCSDVGSLSDVALSSSCEKAMAFSSQQKLLKQQLPTTSGGQNINKLQVIEKNNKETDSSHTTQKVLRQFSAVDKENMDLGIEISILTDKDVEVQVQVEEENDVATDRESKTKGIKHIQQFDRPVAKIRDTSRNQLQRLGALYSNRADLSSPIHRTEGQFHAEEIEKNLELQQRLPQQRLGKLAALANTINQWEDDIPHRVIEDSSKSEMHSKSQKQVDNKIKPSEINLIKEVRGVSSKSNIQSQNATDNKVKSSESNLSKETSSENKFKANKDDAKQLKWDPKVLNSLEAQGFQRRESSTVKVSYEFSEKRNDTEPILNTERGKTEKVEKPVVGKLNTHKYTPAAFNSNSESKTIQSEKNNPVIKTGLVSGRAAIFETQANSKPQSQHQKLEKDPTELSLKERMKLFEKNKGEALVPKAAFGMAPSINKIQDSNPRKEDKPKALHETLRSTATNVHNSTASTPIVRAVLESKVRDKVNALINAASENIIKEDIKKQREEDLQLLTNRYNKQKSIATDQKKHTASSNCDMKKQSQVPPPPPPPQQASVNTTNISSKRRSPGDAFEDENKRPKKVTQQRLYPTLTDLESNDSESDNCCTPTTVSAMNSADEMKVAMHPLNVNSNQNHFNQGLDEDNEDSYMESEEEGSSVDGFKVIRKNDKPSVSKAKDVAYVKDTFDTSNNSSDVSMGVDDYLDEALEENVHDGDDDCSQDEANASRLSRYSDGTTTSNSFSFRKTNTYSGCKSIVEEPKETQHQTFTKKANLNTDMSPSNAIPPVKSEISVNKEDENVVTLVHTVSFYRKQQTSNSANSTPIRKIYREEQVLRSVMDNHDAQKVSNSSVRFQTNSDDTDEDSQSDSEENNINLVHNKIKKLLDEVCKQQQVIAQTSQALNLCAATVEFSGSTESVEGERHLLVATNRRQACLDEVQRLRVEKTLRPIGAPRERGRLTVKEITIPLRQDYIRKLSSDAITGHHLVCLLKYNEHVLATKTVPTLPGLLAVKFPDTLQLNNVYADFKITLEIYGMTAQREVLPHEVKYHINLNKKSGIKTPKKKGSDNRLIMPPVQSPAGPHAVRTPALVQYGFAIFSLREIQRTTWSLTQVLGVSPLEGIVHMKVNCELSVTVDYKGFLTMFEDISGFGAWHRRWCHLNGTMLNYWKYPDDEKKKAPMGTIDLYTCSSLKITIAPRDICARLNTMLLECERPFKETDQESLVIVPNGRTTTVRYLLSADTKEEREEWCAYFNKSLTLLRAWGPPQ